MENQSFIEMSTELLILGISGLELFINSELDVQPLHLCDFCEVGLSWLSGKWLVVAELVSHCWQCLQMFGLWYCVQTLTGCKCFS